MAQDFNAYEVKQIALQLEEDGFAFYTAMSKQAQTNRAKAIFLKLASDEKEHIKWINELGIEDLQLTSDTDAAMVNDYVKSVAKSGIFPNPEKAPEVMETIKKDEDGIKIAMNAESKSVKFFDQMHKNVEDSESKDILLRLMKQEGEHYRLLKEFLAELKK